MSSSKPSKAKVKITVQPPTASAEPEAVEVEPTALATPDPADEAPAALVSPNPEPVPDPAEAEPEPEPEPVPDPLPASAPVPPPRPRQIEAKLRPTRIHAQSRAGGKAWLGTGTVIIAGASLLVFGWAQSYPWRQSTAEHYAKLAQEGSGEVAQLNYRLASLLDAGNQSAAWHTAEAELQAGNVKAADQIMTATVNARQGQGITPDFEAEHVRVLLEAGDTAAAASVATTLTAAPAVTDSQLITAAQALSIAGKGSEAAALASRIGSPQDARRVQAVAVGNVSLASELAGSGLLGSAQSILLKLPSSGPRDLLLAELLSPSKSKTDRTKAASLYADYLTAQPADMTVRLQYATLLDNLKRNNEATQQRAFASKLKLGQP